MSDPDRDLVDFCVPCNPYFPTPGMFAALAAGLEATLKYYPSDSEEVGRRLADTLGLDPDTVVLANGSTELITWADRLLMSGDVAVPVPTFGRWTDQPAETGKRVHPYPLRPADGFRLDPAAFARFVRDRGARAAVVCNPNNPDGGYVRKADVLGLVDALADLDLVVVDESFVDFVTAEPWPSVAADVLGRENVVVLKSLGKNFGLHGVRLGYAVCHPRTAGVLRRALPKWNVNALAEGVVYALRDELPAYHRSLKRIAADRGHLAARLGRLGGLTVYPSEANFILTRLPVGACGPAYRDRLLTEHGVFARECGNKAGIGGHFLRFAVRPPADVDRLVRGLADCLAADPGRPTNDPLRAAAPHDELAVRSH